MNESQCSTFWERIDFLCQKQKVTISQIAKEINISVNDILKMRNANILPETTATVKLSDFLKTTVEYLITGKKKKRTIRFPLFYYWFGYVICAIYIADSVLLFLLLHKFDNEILKAIADCVILALIPIIAGFGYNNYKHLEQNKYIKNELENSLKPLLLRFFLPSNVKSLPDIDGVDFCDLCYRIQRAINKMPSDRFKDFYYTLETDFLNIAGNRITADKIDGAHGFLYGGIIVTLQSILNTKKENEAKIQKHNEELKKQNQLNKIITEEEQLNSVIYVTRPIILMLLDNCLTFSKATFEDFVLPTPKVEKIDLEEYDVYK